MSQPNLKEITYAIYVVGVNLNGRCPYCNKSLKDTSADYKIWHFEQEHTRSRDIK